MMAVMLSVGPAWADGGDDGNGCHWWQDCNDNNNDGGGDAGGLPDVWPLNL